MRRKLFLSILFLATITSVLGQSKKGDVRLTFSGIPLVASTDGSNGLSGFVLKSSVGYYFNNKFSLDFSANYTTNKDLEIDGVQSNYDSYSFVPALRYSFYNKQSLRLFLEGGIGLGTIKYKANNFNEDFIKHDQFSGGISILNAGVGVDYFFNNNLGIQLIVPYLYVKNNTSKYIDTIYSGLAPTLGVTFNL